MDMRRRGISENRKTRKRLGERERMGVKLMIQVRCSENSGQRKA